MIPLHVAAGSLLGVSLIAMLASVVPPFSDLISLAANHSSPYCGSDIQFDYFVGGLIGLVCGLLLFVAPINPRVRSTAIFCWAVKLLTALMLVPIYEYAYGMDIDGYFWIYDMPAFEWGSVHQVGTWYVRFLAWAVFRIIGPSFHGGKVIFSFIGFMGIYLAYRGAVSFIKEERPSLLMLMTLVPTSLFWATSLGKDPIVLFGVGLYCFGVLNWLRSLHPTHAIAIVAGAAVAGLIRPYFLPIMGLPLAAAFLFQTQRPTVRLLSLPLVIAGGAFSVRLFSESMRIASFEAFITYQSKVAADWRGGSSFTLPAIDTPLKLLLVSPLAIFTALFRPMIFEAHNLFALAAAIDNTILLGIFCYAIARSRFREWLKPELVWMGGFVILWAIMYGIGTGNLGAISRFKVQVLPILILLLVYMARRRPSVAAIA